MPSTPSAETLTLLELPSPDGLEVVVDFRPVASDDGIRLVLVKQTIQAEGGRLVLAGPRREILVGWDSDGKPV